MVYVNVNRLHKGLNAMPQPMSLYKSLNRALSEAHRCAKWAEAYGTPAQRDKYQMLVKLMVKLVQEVTPPDTMRDLPTGKDAFLAGASPYSNPYPQGSESYNKWISEFNEAYLANVKATNQTE
jgi:hypothetical protein